MHVASLGQNFVEPPFNAITFASAFFYQLSRDWKKGIDVPLLTLTGIEKPFIKRYIGLTK